MVRATASAPFSLRISCSAFDAHASVGGRRRPLITLPPKEAVETARTDLHHQSPETFRRAPGFRHVRADLRGQCGRGSAREPLARGDITAQGPLSGWPVLTPLMSSIRVLAVPAAVVTRVDVVKRHGPSHCRSCALLAVELLEQPIRADSDNAAVPGQFRDLPVRPDRNRRLVLLGLARHLNDRRIGQP
jgi:hypothetical protein